MTPLIRGDRSGLMSFVLIVGMFSWMIQSGIKAEATCGRPGRTRNANHIPPGYSFNAGDRIRYICTTEGDAILGQSERECLSNGEWSGEIPVCSQIITIEEAHLSHEDPKMGASLSVDRDISTCAGMPTITKTSWEGSTNFSATISGVRIVLQGGGRSQIEVKIKDDYSPEFTCKDGNQNKAGSLETTKIFTFFCPPGTTGKYIYIRDMLQALRICEVTAYRSTLQQCLTPDIPRHANSRVVASGKKSEYFFECHSGYKRWGTLNTTCQPDGTWHPKSPRCEKIRCSHPRQPENGEVEYDFINGTVPFNGTARYRCHSGFYMEGNSAIRCLQWETWDFPQPKCKPVTSETSFSSKAQHCGGLPQVANGDVTSNYTSNGLTAWLKCNEGFKPLTTDRIFCLTTREWSQSFSCTIIQCETNPIVPHGAAILLNNSSYYGSPLQILCNQGYTSHQPIIRKCEASGTWGDLSVCVEITCGVFVSNETNGGKWISLNDSYSIRILTCPEDFHIEGSPPVSRCLSNGSWSYTSAKCKGSMKDDYWGNGWPPSLMIIAAVCVGMGTALFILCLSKIYTAIRKRRHSTTNTTVFHLENKPRKHGSGTPNYRQAKHHSVQEPYEDAVELRHKTVCKNPRKPHSALPNLPLDTDPVYAQPFETSAMTKKISASNVNKKEDFYNTHIYAEPVNAKPSSVEPSNVRVSRVTNDMGTPTVKATLRNMSSGSPSQQNCNKPCAIYDSSSNSPSYESGNLTLSVGAKYQQNSERTGLDTFTHDSEYLELL